MRRSILTEKISRRGYHLSRELAVDPLEIFFVREAMRTNIVALSDTFSQQDLASLLDSNHNMDVQIQRLYPVLGAEKRLEGVVTRRDLQHLLHEGSLLSQEDASAIQQGDGTKHVEGGSSEGDQEVGLRS